MLLSITPHYAEIKFQEGRAVGRHLRTFKDNIDRPLAAILTLNTIAHTVGAIGVGAEDIAEPDASVDVVMMFKSLHHVPVARMDKALEEITKVLRPGGFAYISEPVFEGTFNDIMRIFHNEEYVRSQAFDAIARSITAGHFVLKQECFFKNIIRFQSWEQYEQAVLNVTHTDHRLTPGQLAEVKRRFLSHESDGGFAFEIPNRVDLLTKP